jgi:hypothetical protein
VAGWVDANINDFRVGYDYKNQVIAKAITQAKGMKQGRYGNCVRLPAGAADGVMVAEAEPGAPTIPDWAHTHEKFQRCAFQAALLAMALLGHPKEAEANARIAAKNPKTYHSLNLTKGEKSVGTVFARAKASDVPVTFVKVGVPPKVEGAANWAPTLLSAALEDVYVARIGGHTYVVAAGYIYDPDWPTAVTLTAHFLQSLVAQRGEIGPVVLVQNKSHTTGTGCAKRQKVKP